MFGYFYTQPLETGICSEQFQFYRIVRSLNLRLQIAKVESVALLLAKRRLTRARWRLLLGSWRSTYRGIVGVLSPRLSCSPPFLLSIRIYPYIIVSSLTVPYHPPATVIPLPTTHTCTSSPSFLHYLTLWLPPYPFATRHPSPFGSSFPLYSVSHTWTHSPPHHSIHPPHILSLPLIPPIPDPHTCTLSPCYLSSPFLLFSSPVLSTCRCLLLLSFVRILTASRWSTC